VRLDCFIDAGIAKNNANIPDHRYVLEAICRRDEEESDRRIRGHIMHVLLPELQAELGMNY